MARERAARSELQIRPRRGRDRVPGPLSHDHAGVQGGVPARVQARRRVPPLPQAGLSALPAAESPQIVRAGVSEAAATAGGAGERAGVIAPLTSPSAPLSALARALRGSFFRNRRPTEERRSGG